MALFPCAAALVSGWFAWSVLHRFLRSHAPQQLAWAVALTLFSLASLAAAAGMSLGWSAGWFRTYYYLGAVVNVPVLALGTLYLYLPRRLGHLLATLVAALAAYAAIVVMGAEIDPALRGIEGAIPTGSEVIAEGPRRLSRYYSYSGFVIVVTGALWSALKLRRRPGEGPRRLMQGNVLIAAGTSVVAVASVLARQGSGSVFAVGLAVGVAVMYAGFVRASGPTLTDSRQAATELPGDAL